MQQGDVLLYQSIDGGEINVTEGVIAMSAGLDTAVYLSLFGGNEDCSGRATCPFTWWGNHMETSVAFKQISETQYLLRTIPATTFNLRRVEDAIERDLNWLLTENVASSVKSTVTIPGVDKIKIAVTINAEGIESKFSFVENWKNSA